MRIPVLILFLTVITSVCSQTIGTGFNKNMYTCSVSGELYNNGRNDGNLGNGTLAHSSDLVKVNGLSDIVQIDGGWQHTVALKNDGTVWTWGVNYSGQLGYGPLASSPLAVQVQGLSDIVMIAAGYNYSMALSSNGRLYAWGDNSSGQLGLGGSAVGTAVGSPQLISISNVIYISAGVNHSLAVKSDGTVWAWGRGDFGQLGIITTDNQASPVQVNGLYDIVEVAASRMASFALSSNGQVYAWGYNLNGIVGDPSYYQHTVPATGSIVNAVHIDAGEHHCLYLMNDGTVRATGGNYYGQIGDGTDNNAFLPKRSSQIEDIVKISAGGNQSMALKSDGTMYVWGNNQYGQALDNDGTTNSILKPIEFDNVCPEIPEDTAEAIEFRIVPNPSNGLIRIEGGSHEDSRVEVFNLAGSLIKSEHTISNSLDLSNLPSGVYVLRVRLDDRLVVHKVSIIN